MKEEINKIIANYAHDYRHTKMSQIALVGMLDSFLEEVLPFFAQSKISDIKSEIARLEGMKKEMQENNLPLIDGELHKESVKVGFNSALQDQIPHLKLLTKR